MTKKLKDIYKSLIDHDNDLTKINNLVLKIKDEYVDRLNKKTLTPREKERYLYNIEEILNFVGDISQQIFDSQTPLKIAYDNMYKNSSPKLGKEVFLREYIGLHKPYDDTKNRIWKLLFFMKGMKERNII